MENKFKAGDIVRSFFNVDFIYGITQINPDLTINGVILENMKDKDLYSFASLTFVNCPTDVLYKVKLTPKYKLKFLERLDELLFKKKIDNLSYIDTMAALIYGK
jgi:hypothetical protein